MFLSSISIYSLLASLILLSEASSKAPRRLKRLAHPTTDHVDIFPRNSKRTTDSSDSLRFDDSFRLTLTAFEETFHLHLTPNDHLIHPSARVIHHAHDPVTGETFETGSVPLSRESVRAYEGHVLHSDHTEGRKKEDLAGVKEGYSSYPERGWARVLVFEHEEGKSPVYEGAFSVDGTIHHIMTKVNYQRVKRPTDAEPLDLDEGMVIWRDSDILSEEEEHFERTGLPLPSSFRATQSPSCGHDRLDFNVDPLLNDALRAPGFTPWPQLWPRQDDTRDGNGGGMGTNFADRIGQTAGCPTSQRILYMGVAADCAYVAKYGTPEEATQKILSDWNSASSLYKSTFNISLGIIELSVQQSVCPSQASSSVPWNVGCDTQIDQRLSLFSAWRGSKGDDGAGLWHLMSGCPTGQEVGIAWMATLCRQSSSSSNGQSVSGTGVSTFGMTEWQVVAHEVGHNFGAIHDCTEGCATSGTSNCCPLSTSSCDTSSKYVMSPVTRDGEFTFSPCSVGNICSLMGDSGGRGSMDTSCLLDPNQNQRPLISLKMCGNGIVETDQGEECDPGTGKSSPCCDSNTCKFINNARCDPQSSACCTDQCQFASSEQVCRPSRDGRCDQEERCSGTSATCPNDVTSPNGQSCGDGDLKCASGRCTSVALQCQSVGASLGLKAACPQSSNTCELTCQNPNSPNSCVRLSSLMVDGSPCGFAGECQGGQCKQGSWLDTAKAWYRQNLQISIPVTVAAGIIVLSMIYCCISSCFRRRQAKKAGISPSAGPRPISSFVPGARPLSAAPSRRSRLSRHSQRLGSRDSQVGPTLNGQYPPPNGPPPSGYVSPHNGYVPAQPRYGSPPQQGGYGRGY